MNRKSSTTLTISAVAFIAALLIDLYLILVYPSMIQVIIAVSLIVVVDTYFLVDGILAKVDEIQLIIRLCDGIRRTDFVCRNRGATPCKECSKNNKADRDDSGQFSRRRCVLRAL